MGMDRGNHGRIFDGGDDRQGTAALRTLRDVDIEYSFKLNNWAKCHGACKNPQVWATTIPHPLHSHRGVEMTLAAGNSMVTMSIPVPRSGDEGMVQKRAVGGDPTVILLRAAVDIGDCAWTGSRSQDGASVCTRSRVAALPAWGARGEAACRAQRVRARAGAGGAVFGADPLSRAAGEPSVSGQLRR
jgi:hypothetical protein